jgi:hypothetical protein
MHLLTLCAFMMWEGWVCKVYVLQCGNVGSNILVRPSNLLEKSSSYVRDILTQICYNFRSCIWGTLKCICHYFPCVLNGSITCTIYHWTGHHGNLWDVPHFKKQFHRRSVTYVGQFTLAVETVSQSYHPSHCSGMIDICSVTPLRMRYVQCKLGWTRSVMKGTLLLMPKEFSVRITHPTAVG